MNFQYYHARIRTTHGMAAVLWSFKRRSWQWVFMHPMRGTMTVTFRRPLT